MAKNPNTPLAPKTMFLGNDESFDQPIPGSNEDKLLRVYITQLLSEFSLLPASAEKPTTEETAARDCVARISELLPVEWRWSDAYALERCTVIVEPEQRLRRRIPLLRDEFATIAGPEAYKQYMDSGPPVPSDSEVKPLNSAPMH